MCENPSGKAGLGVRLGGGQVLHETFWRLRDWEGYLVYDGPPPNGKPMVFLTLEEAEEKLRVTGWDQDGMQAEPFEG